LLKKIVITIILICSAGFSQDNTSLTKSICDDYKELDQFLDSLVIRIEKKYANDSLFLTKLRASQKDWIAFKESQLELKFPHPDKKSKYGENYRMCVCLELIQLLSARIKQLTPWETGIVGDEDEVCPGSILVD
jgi:hypothetical protein